MSHQFILHIAMNRTRTHNHRGETQVIKCQLFHHLVIKLFVCNNENERFLPLIVTRWKFRPASFTRFPGYCHGWVNLVATEFGLIWKNKPSGCHNGFWKIFCWHAYSCLKGTLTRLLQRHRIQTGFSPWI